MPRFWDYQEVEVDLNIEVDDFYEEMDSEDCERMMKLLKEGGYGNNLEEPSGRSSWEFDEAISKLKQNYHSLSNEDTDLIIKLSKRF